MTTMEASVSFTDNTIYQHLFAAKERFRQQNRHRHWSEEELELEWTRLLSTTGAGLGPATTGGYTPEIPRTMPSWTGRSFGPSADTTSDGNQAYDMNRDQGLSTQSAPVMAHSMSRTPSSRAVAKRSYSTFAAPGNPPATIARWQNEPDVPFSNYTISTHAGNARKRSRPMPTVVDATEHNLEEWIQAHSDLNLALPPTRPVFNNTYPALAQQDPTHLTVSIPASATYLDRPFTESPVPSTPVSDLTDASTMSTQMSRGLSTVSALSTSSSSLPRAMNDMHLAPTFSDFSSSDFDFKPLTQENLNTASLQYPTQLQSSKSCEINGGAIQSSPVDFSSSAPSATISSESTLSASHTAQPMKREDSSSSALSSSSRSNQSRSTRRHFEQLQNAKTPIAPKVDVTQHDTAPQMKRIISTDGSTKEVAQIPRKQPVQRQQRDKLYCPYCNDHTEGFRGEHELQRHTNRAHSSTRKVWICIDVKRSNPTFLSQCKACRDGKRYGAYYNAAAHLRRTHFNPRKRGRKAKTEAEKRGGKGGGNWPAMDHLKECWMREIEEVVDDKSPPVDYSIASEDQIADTDVNTSSDDDNEEQHSSQQAPDSASSATSFDESAVWGTESFVDASAAASTAADMLSFEFTVPTNSAQPSLDVTSTFDEQPFSMFDVSPVDMGVFNFEDNFGQLAPVYQEITAWTQ